MTADTIFINQTSAKGSFTLHFDLAHAAVTIVALIVTNLALKSAGVINEENKHQLNWKVFLAYFVVVFIINLVWPI
ncbi:hypothetical protein [Ruegeria sp. HKCCA6837]|uniref:hypothetical protein n=1 Tax=Ruegeria sp. HKCCA6837 TaxID=2682989 RepID=UPI0014896C82|nr:hypothetical protein [Ruegeria sp. HKCCA6837]